MKTTKEHHSLLAVLEAAARTYQGAWSAFSHGKHHGMAAFAAYEATERMEMAEQVAQHMAEHEEHVVYGALAAPACDYKTPADALLALCAADAGIVAVAETVYDAGLASGERPYFLQRMRDDLDYQLTEVKGVKDMLARAGSPAEVEALNKKLLRKYTAKHA